MTAADEHLATAVAGDPHARPATHGRWVAVRRALPREPGLLMAGGFLTLVALSALVPGLFSSADPLTGVPRDKLRPPGPGHWFGTDQIGRDLFSRVVHGAWLSLEATALAVGVGLLIGSVLGLLAGFLGRWIDELLMRAVDVLLAVPALLLSLALVTVLGFGTLKVALAVGVGTVATFARVLRAEVLRVRGSAYVEAARSCGVRWHGVLLRHVLPNAYGPVLVLATLEFGVAVLAVSALSFLGYGAPPPAPEWGSLVAEGRNYLATAWWLTVLPGLAVALTVLSAGRVARALDRERGVPR